MEKPIKYRAWDDGKMYNVRAIIWHNGQVANIEVFTDKGTMYLYSTNAHLIQFTGLYDCKRTEEYPKGQAVYEGDIPGRWLAGCYIGYCEKCKQLQVISKYDGCMACQGYIHWYDVVESANDGTLEIVGNRWENPELLEQEVDANV